MLSSKKTKYILIMILVFTIIYYLNHMYKLYEGFTQSKWSTELVDKFLNYQKKNKPQYRF